MIATPAHAPRSRPSRARASLAGAPLIALSVACTPAPAPTPAGELLALVDVHVVPMDREQVLRDRTVLVDGGRIACVGTPTQCPVPDGAREVSGPGWLLPGLIDAHVHLQHVDELPLYLMNGVTTVVNLSGLPRHLEMRESVASGSRIGPTIFTAGRTIDGDPPRNPRFQPLGDPTAADALIASQLDAGYDFIKLYDLLEADAYAAIVRAAEARGATIVGHVPKKIGLEGILDGHALIAHAEELYYTFFDNRPQPDRIEAAARLLIDHDIALCPNIGFIRAIIEQAEDVEAVLARPELRYVPPSVLADWQPESNRYVGRPDEWLARNRVMYRFLLELVRGLHDAGVTLVTGTDASVPGAAPGFSIHDELDDLVAAGLPPYRALRTATVTSGSWLAAHLDDGPERGVVAAGGAADLVLVRSDPLADVRAARDVIGVVVRGRWHDAAELRDQAEARSVRYARSWDRYREFRAALDQRQFDDAETRIRTASSEGDSLLTESALNRLGYHYLFDRREVDVAVELLAMVVRAHPDSSNAYDSLGEAHKVAGHTDRAIANYRRSLELNPANANAVRQLAELGAEP